MRRGRSARGSPAVTAPSPWIKPIPASQTTVRGPHPPLQLLDEVDEVDELDEAIFNASLGQAMEQVNVHGLTIGEYIVASSTWQDCWLVR